MGSNKIFLKLFIYWNKIDLSYKKKTLMTAFFGEKNHTWAKITIGESIGEVTPISFGLIKLVRRYRHKTSFVIS